MGFKLIVSMGRFANIIELEPRTLLMMESSFT